jgi:hypothetical protein
MALSQGEQINDLLVLEPTTTAWMYQRDSAKLGPLGESFVKLLMSLEEAQVEYDNLPGISVGVPATEQHIRF